MGHVITIHLDRRVAVRGVVVRRHRAARAVVLVLGTMTEVRRDKMHYVSSAFHFLSYVSLSLLKNCIHKIYIYDGITTPI